MSLECAECERDLRGGHSPDCSRCPKCIHCGASLRVKDEEQGYVCPNECTDPTDKLAALLREWAETWDENAPEELAHWLTERGVVVREPDDLILSPHHEQCPDCAGEGSVGHWRESSVCTRCSGEGYVKKEGRFGPRPPNSVPWEQRERAVYTTESMKREMEERLSPPPIKPSEAAIEALLDEIVGPADTRPQFEKRLAMRPTAAKLASVILCTQFGSEAK